MSYWTYWLACCDCTHVWRDSDPPAEELLRCPACGSDEIDGTITNDPEDLPL